MAGWYEQYQAMQGAKEGGNGGDSGVAVAPIGSDDWAQQQARKELSAGNTAPRLTRGDGYAYTISQQGLVQNWMDKLNPSLAAYREASIGRTKAVGAFQDKLAQLGAQIGELKELKKSYFYGNADWITRWLIDNNIRKLSVQMQGLNPPEMLPAPGTPSTAYELKSEPGGESIWIGGTPQMMPAPQRVRGTPEERVGYEAPTSLPIPDWLRGYLESSMGPAGVGGQVRGAGAASSAYGGANGGDLRSRGAYTMRPLGAQEELSTEKLGQMTGYLGWGKAGAPLEFSEGYLRQMENLPDWWQEYVKQSQKLFPATVSMPKPQWRAMAQ